MIINEKCIFCNECGLNCNHLAREDECEYWQEQVKGRLVMLPVDDLIPHPDNPRKDLGDLTELAESIKATGILQNLTVVPNIMEDSTGARWMDGYRVIIGHRRTAAAKKAGLESVPCVIARMDEREQLATMMLENMQRSDLTVYEQAEGFQLMLDLGETVGTISEKTGFSETTIRRRVKLAELDRDKLKKAAGRGVTLRDFEKLNKIEDIEARNRVLAYTGTNDFDRELQKAMREQKDRAYMQKITAEFRETDWCRELTKEELDDMRACGKANYYINYGTWNPGELVKPADAGERQYYFKVCDSKVDVYRECRQEDRAETPQQRRKKELAGEMNRILNELRMQEEEFRDLRESFIDNFDQFNTYEDEIMAFASKAMICRLGESGYKRCLELDAVASMLNLGYDEDGEKIVEQDLDAAARSRAGQLLLCTAYFALEDGDRKWFEERWDGELGMSRPFAREDPQLDLLYKCLRALGYEWSAEEQSASVGDSELLREARKLIERYKAETE